MAGSIERVTEAAKAAGMAIDVKRMGASTRTSEEAAAQCGCGVDQIVKSLKPATGFICSCCRRARRGLFIRPHKLLDAAKATVADIAE